MEAVMITLGDQTQNDQKMEANVPTATDYTYAEISRTGGATWHPTADVPTTGFMVGVRGYEYTTDVYDFSPTLLDQYSAVTPLPDGAFYGAWVESDTVYLDVSVWVASLSEALLIADVEDQLAVYDITAQATRRVS